MLKLNKKGQASSTFQLLIAAVVALAILGVLLSLLNVIPKPNAEPTNATKTLLQTQINNPGAESCTDPVTFTRSKSTISAEGITINSGLDPSQVYFDDPEKIGNFTTSQALLRYESTTSKKVVMCIICSSDQEYLELAIKANDEENSSDFLMPADVDNLSTGQTVCIIYPRKTSS